MITRLITACCFLLLSNYSSGQNYILPEGEFMDTTANHDTACKDYNIYYYSVGGKHPENSYTLRNEVVSFLKKENTLYAGSGYITYQFTIDCVGYKMRKTKVLQTDESYKSYHFDKGLIAALYSFVNTLGNWRICRYKDGQALPYKAFMTFKIKNGKVINIIP